MKKQNSKKLMEFEIGLAFDLNISHKYGKECYSALALDCIEEHEHCGWCD